MAFYPQFPGFYAYPVPYPNQDFYAMYPPGSAPGSGLEHPPGPHPPAGNSGPIFFDGIPPPVNNGKTYGHGPMAGKPGFNNRKDSTDSGISDYSSNYSSRKSSAMSDFGSRKSSAMSDFGARKSSGLSDFGSRKSSAVSTTSSTGASAFSFGGFEESLLEDVKEEEPYEDPDDDLCEKIVAQVEFYFSDANITKDKFLLKHVKRNKEGFVSLKLISSFKRVKHLTKDWRQVAEAIERKSNRLEVNDLKTKVRRLDPLPEYDETTPSRTVVALNLPLERPTIEAVAEIFSVVGEIVLVRILRPGNPIPADVKPFANKHPEMTAKVCALVEFERTEFALKAVRELSNEGEDEESKEKMQVMELTAPPPKTTKSKEEKSTKKASILLMKQQVQQQLQAAAAAQAVQQAHHQHALHQAQPSFGIGQTPTRRYSHAGFGHAPQPPHTPYYTPPQNNTSSGAAPGEELGPRRRISLQNMKYNPIAEDQAAHRPGAPLKSGQMEMGLNPNAPTFTMQQQQRKFSRPSSNPFMPPHHPMHDGMMGPVPPSAAHAAQAAHAAAAHAAAAAAHAAYHQHQNAAAAQAVAAGMPIPVRRFSSISGHPMEFSTSGLTLPPNVIRLPRGPEKNSKGFNKWCRNRMFSHQQPESPQTSAATVQPPARKPGSHAVPIVAPPAEDKASKPTNAEEDTKDVAEDSKKPEIGEAVKSEEEAVVEAAAVGRDEVDGAVAVAPEPAAIPAAAAAAAAAAGVESNSESGDSGNEDEGSISDQDQPELQNQPDREGGIFAARLTMDVDVNEKIR